MFAHTLLSLLLLCVVFDGALAIESIPYDPSLVLGQIIKDEKLVQLKALADQQKGVSAMFDEYNANLQLKLSIDMSIRELSQLGLNTPDTLKTSLTEVEKAIETSLTAYVTAKIDYNKAVVTSKTTGANSGIDSAPTSPIDFSKSKIMNQPWSSDSFNIDTQYFRVESNEQGSDTHASKVAGYVASQLSIGKGFSVSADVKDDVQKQVSSQHSSHDILGTLVFVARATHKNAAMYSPLFYDIGNMQAAWNELGDDPVDLPANQEKWAKQLMGAKPGSGKHVTVLTGVTYGSSFIGFIHYTQSESTQSHQETEASHVAAEAAAKVAYWSLSFSGGAGFSDDQSNDIKDLLSTAQINTHMSCITMGMIPSIKSNTIKQAIQGFTKFSPDDTMSKMAILMDDAAGAVPKGADVISNARKGGTLTELESKKTTSVLNAIGKIDEAQNQVIDMNSMMIALDDYIQITRGADSGVPINFYTSKFDANDVIHEWFSQNNPGFMDCINQGGVDCWNESTGLKDKDKAAP